MVMSSGAEGIRFIAAPLSGVINTTFTSVAPSLILWHLREGEVLKGPGELDRPIAGDCGAMHSALETEVDAVELEAHGFIERAKIVIGALER